MLYYITSPHIDPVKHLTLLDLISQTYAVTLCLQIKIHINPLCKKKKRAERGREKHRKERREGTEWETLNKRCHLPRWNFNEVNSQSLPTERGANSSCNLSANQSQTSPVRGGGGLSSVPLKKYSTSYDSELQCVLKKLL